MNPASADIAIIGMAARFAAAPDLAAFWDNVLGKVDAVHDASDAWSGPHFDPRANANDRIYTRRGGFLGDAVDFHPLSHGVMPSAVGGGDADHFLALDAGAAALHDAGYAERPFDREGTAVILGHGTYVNRGYDTLLQHGQVVDQTVALLRQVAPQLQDSALFRIREAIKASLPPFSAASVPALVPNIIAGRIANRLDLKGPNYIVDAACASSLVALELAVRELASGRCSMALTGGVHASTPPQIYMMFCLLNALSRGNVRPFDKAADGTLLGEGVGILVLKRRADAERDGDRIYALVAGVGTSSDGRALGLLTPRADGQIIALQRAYAECGIDPETVHLLEAHGTGTAVGDTTEVQSLSAIFGRAREAVPQRALGSVKSMIGHCISAAGAAGIIKTALALHDRVLPPTLCDQVNEQLGVAEASFYVNTETRPWIASGARAPRRAAVDAFGFGGVNAHAVLEEYRGPAQSEAVVQRRWPSELLVFAGDSAANVVDLLQKVRQACSGKMAPPLAVLARASIRYARGPVRMAIIGRDHEQLRNAVEAGIATLQTDAGARARHPEVIVGSAETGDPGLTAWLFPGEGSQYRNMLAQLCVCFPSVRAWFDLLDDVYDDLDAPPPSRAIFPPPTCLTDADDARLNAELTSFDVGSAAVFTASMALHELLTRFGLSPDAVLGHSTGEGAALIAAGAMRQQGRSQLIAAMRDFYATCRSLEHEGRIPKGQLLSVGALESAKLERILASHSGCVYLALDNCANQKVVFCETATTAVLVERIHAAGGVCSIMPLDRAYHTPMLAELEEVLRKLYAALPIAAPRHALYSCVTAQCVPDDPESIRALAMRQWFSPVRFRETLLELHAPGVRTFVEVGPGAALTSFVRDTLARGKSLALATNIPGRPALAHLQRVLGELFVRGSDIDFAPLYEHRRIEHSEAVAAQAASVMRLPLTMPVMRLPDDFTASSATNREAEGQRQSAIPAPDTVEEFKEAGPEDRSRRVRAGRLEALQAHFETMRQFMSAQERVMTMALHRASGPPSVERRQTPSLSDDAARRWHWLGRIVVRDSARLVCERVFDVNTDAMLRDHALGGRPSSRNPRLLALPVVPFTVAMEIVAEAASCLAGPHLKVVEMRELKGHRWLALDSGQLRIEIVAQLQAHHADDRAEVAVTIREERTPLQPSAVLFEGIVSLARERVISGRRYLPALSNPCATHYTDRMLYDSGGKAVDRYAPMFHGPYFQGIERLDGWDVSGIDAVMRIGAGDASQRSTEPDSILDPVLLDCAGQLIGYWVAERYGVDLTFFPFSVRRYMQCGKRPGAGEIVKCRARVALRCDDQAIVPRFEFVDDRGNVMRACGEAAPPDLRDRPERYHACRLQPATAFLVASFEFEDAAGNVFVRLEDWRDRYFSIPHAHYRCHLSPQHEFLSQPWLQRESGEVCRRVSTSGEYLEAAGRIWTRALAHLMLSDAERECWANLPEKGSRSTEWLLGRVAAKDAVRQWMRERCDVQLAPADVEVLPDATRRPVVRIPGLDAPRRCPAVTISHGGGVAAALAFDPAERKGIDVQSIKDAGLDEVRTAAFTHDEWAGLAQWSGARDAPHIIGWCAKEAAGKAAAAGPVGDPIEWVVRPVAGAVDRVEVIHGVERYRVDLFRDEGRLVALAAAIGAPTDETDGNAPVGPVARHGSPTSRQGGHTSW